MNLAAVVALMKVSSTTWNSAFWQILVTKTLSLLKIYAKTFRSTKSNVKNLHFFYLWRWFFVRFSDRGVSNMAWLRLTAGCVELHMTLRCGVVFYFCYSVIFIYLFILFLTRYRWNDGGRRRVTGPAAHERYVCFRFPKTDIVIFLFFYLFFFLTTTPPTADGPSKSGLDLV